MKPSEVIAEKLDRVQLRRAMGDSRDHSYVHPSGIGRCMRQIVLEMSKYGESKTLLEPRKYRIFENGHYYHTRLSEELKEAGILVRNEMRMRSDLYNMGGSTDDVVLLETETGGGELVLIEGKSANKRGFEWQRDNGIDHKYLDQLQTYMFLTGIHKGVIVMECKDNQERLYVDVDYDERKAAKLLGKTKCINFTLSEGMIPAREEVYTRTCFDCKYCPYGEECWAQTPGSYKYVKPEGA